MSDNPNAAKSANSGTSGSAIVLPNIQYIYALDYTSGTIKPHKLTDATGALSTTGLNRSTAVNGQQFYASPNGKFLFLPGYSTNNVYGFQVGLDGNLTQISTSPWSLPSGGQSLTVSPDGRDLYVTSESPGDLWDYSIDSQGRLAASTAGASYPVSANVWRTLMHPSGKFVFVGSYSDGKIWAYARNTSTGALTAAPGSPYAALAATSYLVTDPAGKFLIESAWGVGMKSFSIDANTGALSAVTTLGAPAGMAAIVMDPGGTCIYGIDYQNSKLVGFSVNSTTGAIAALGGSYPISVANLNFGALEIDKNGKYLYAGTSDGKLHSYTVDSSTGQLAATSGFPLTTGLSSVDYVGVIKPQY